MGQKDAENGDAINIGDTLLHQNYGDMLQVSFYIRKL